MKKDIKIDITAEELKAICKEYEFDEEKDMFEENEHLYMAKKALSQLEKSEYIIYCLYMEYQSERKVANLLGVSRTPINREIHKITSKLKTFINDDTTA